MVDDWELKRSQLEGHQANYLLRRVVLQFAEGRCGEENTSAEADLAEALSRDPSLGPAVAPMLGWFALKHVSKGQGGLGTTKAEMLESVRAFLKERLPLESLAPDGVWGPVARADIIREVCLLLKRLIGAFHGVGAQVGDACLHSLAIDDGALSSAKADAQHSRARTKRIAARLNMVPLPRQIGVLVHPVAGATSSSQTTLQRERLQPFLRAGLNPSATPRASLRPIGGQAAR